jgi:hypothetical protein
LFDQMSAAEQSHLAADAVDAHPNFLGHVFVSIDPKRGARRSADDLANPSPHLIIVRTAIPSLPFKR